MASTRKTLASMSGNQAESMGVRTDNVQPRLSPVASAKDTGRRPLRNIGRVDIEQVVPDPGQPRLEFSEDAIERLAQSIHDKGQLSAIRVRWSEQLQKWVIIAGERRYRATKRAGLKTIDCYFHDGELAKSEVLEQQLIENCLREDLKPVEEAKAFCLLMELNGWTGKQVAKALRVPASKVSRGLALLKLPDDILAKVDSGEIATRAAYELSKLDGNPARRELAKKAGAGKLTLEQTASAVRQRRGKQKRRSRNTRQVFLTENGWKVSVSANKSGDYLDIEQALQEALDEVRHRLANNVQLFS